MSYQDEIVISTQTEKGFLGYVFGIWLAGVFAASLFGRSHMIGAGVMIAMGVSIFWPLVIFLTGHWSLVPDSPGVMRLFALWLFIVFAGLSIFASVDPTVSIIYYGLTLVSFLLSLQFNSNLSARQYETGLKTYALLTAIMLSGFAIYDYRAGGSRLGLGTGLLNPNAIGLVSVSVLLAAASFRNLFIRAALFLPVAIVIILTKSRTSAIGAAIGLAILFFLRFRMAKKGMKYAVFALLFVSVIIAVIYSDQLIRALETFFEVHSSHRGVGSGASGRFTIWARTWEAFRDNPILGIGFRAHETLFGGSSHNGYLALLAEIGFIGFAGSIYLVLSGIGVLWRDTRSARFVHTHSILAGLCCGYLFLAMFERYLFNIGNPTSLLFMIGIMRTARRPGHDPAYEPAANQGGA